MLLYALYVYDRPLDIQTWTTKDMFDKHSCNACYENCVHTSACHKESNIAIHNFSHDNKKKQT